MSDKKITVPLQLIHDAVEMAADEWDQYLDLEEMRIVSIPQDAGVFDGTDEEYEQIREMIDAKWNERYFALPDRYDIHEYIIMERFIDSLPSGKIQDELAYAIRGRGAFRRFKDGIIRYGIEKDWYEYLDRAYYEIAEQWCEVHDFAYYDDRKKDPVRQEPDKEERDSLAWEEVHTEHLVRDEWIDFRSTSWRFPNGNIYEPFYSYSRRDYAVIVASDTDGRYICVRQFRQGIRKVTTEFPAGGIERRDGKEYGEAGGSESENALAAAKRELLEETGYESDDWTHLLTVPSNATIADNYAHLFVARNCRKTAEPEPDEMEFLEVVRLCADEIEEMVEKGTFQQAMHITAWLLAKRR